MFSGARVNRVRHSKDRRGDRRAFAVAFFVVGLRALLFFHGAANIDDVVGNDAETDPALHSSFALVATAVEPVSPFDHADAALASGAPLLAVTKPTLLLFAFAFGAFGGAIGNAHSLDPLGFCRHLVLGGVESSISGHQVRNASEHRLMGFNGSNQQV